jgi:hypothetical protein
MDGDDLGSGRDLSELGLDALPFARELIDLRVVGVEIRALRNVRDQTIDLAVELDDAGYGQLDWSARLLPARVRERYLGRSRRGSIADTRLLH